MTGTPTKIQSLRLAGLFSGIGGLEFGLESAGHRTVMTCEIDQGARMVLDKRFPGIECHDDVRTISAFPHNINAICAGFPCQDLSSVGDKIGIGGRNSSIVTHVFRLLRRHPVEWVIIENVKFMLHLDQGSAMSLIIDSLEKLGYCWAYRVVDSFNFGLPQRRHRVFIVASLSGDPRDVLLSEDAKQVERPVGRNPAYGFYWTEGTYATGIAIDGIPPLKGGSSIGIASPPAILMPDGFVGTPDIRDAERLQGFLVNWTLPAEEAVKSSYRWKLVGNAVTVPVAKWLGERLVNPLPYDFDADVSFKGKWPEAAWGDRGKRFRANVSQRPVARVAIAIQDFLRYPLKPLSEKATRGFLVRAQKGNLRFPNGFLTHLAAHCDRCPRS
jgi:DNA (cytosine-5)-methyltransferase 1